MLADCYANTARPIPSPDDPLGPHQLSGSAPSTLLGAFQTRADVTLLAHSTTVYWTKGVVRWCAAEARPHVLLDHMACATSQLERSNSAPHVVASCHRDRSCVRRPLATLNSESGAP